MSIKTRKILLFLLVCAFIGQTWLVYSDPTGKQTPPLSSLASTGREIWHQKNCQSCHQLYGFGGFLGPDLTNISSTITPERFNSILTVGAGQMPTFHFNKQERTAIRQFLKELDQTGVSQPRAYPKTSPTDILLNVAQKSPLTSTERNGFKIVKAKNCLSCHLPNTKSAFRAPDLTTIAKKLTKTEILQTVRQGRPAKGMPPFKFSTTEESHLYHYLQWLEKNRDSITDRFSKAENQNRSYKIPWFAYER